MIQYYYPNEKRFVDTLGVIWTPRNTDFMEVVGKVSYNWEDKVTIGANVFHAWDWLGTGADGTYASSPRSTIFPSWKDCRSRASSVATGSAPPTNIAFPVAIRLPDYNYWNIGASYTYKNLTADIRYHDTNLSKTQCFTLTSDPARQSWQCGRGLHLELVQPDRRRHALLRHHGEQPRHLRPAK